MSDVVRRYLPSASGAAIARLTDPDVRAALRAAIGDLEIMVRTDVDPSDPRSAPMTLDELELLELTESEHGSFTPDVEPLEAMGTGAQRAFLMSILELYADTTSWPMTSPILITLEEPEAGLHPAAQRQVAQALARLNDVTGVQVVITTHSPTVIHAAPARSVRLVQAREKDREPRIVLPESLQEVASELGTRPGRHPTSRAVRDRRRTSRCRRSY